MLANLRACCVAAAQVLSLGAHLDELTTSAFEAMTGARAHLVVFTLQPSAGRTVRLVKDRHFCASGMPATSKLVVVIGGMGSNKTGSIAELDATRFVPLHRSALADQADIRISLTIKRDGQIRAAPVG